ncbi:Multimodular transpeptidase-transglycosylase [hydrothermal vent metagenome]|uniref:Penicillin-binding protein 1B n=1 Tax=hydrothermal vent metagenome TaxID=652676 RepID=A0A3B1BM99_9ZZZZ
MPKPSARKLRSSSSSRKKRKPASINTPGGKPGPKKTSARRSRAKTTSAKRPASFLKRHSPLLFLLTTLILLAWLAYLDAIIRNQFEGKRWALPATVYARPLELYVGEKLSVSQLLREIELSGYRPVQKARSTGTFSLHANTFDVVARAFQYGDSFEKSRHLRLRIKHGQVVAVQLLPSETALDIVRLEPAVIGRIYPTQHEDRLLVRLKNVPTMLVKGLIALEDRAFYRHHGLDPRAMGRALWADLRARRLVQGGSTLTQQLVKNFFLSNQRSLWRKLNEAAMALLLEWHYDKDEILEAYLNEIYLGQDGRRAIHGFGLASHYYFDRSLMRLRLHEIATLIALVRGPSYYDAWRHPQRLLKRRNLVLSVMHEQGLISSAKETAAQKKPLGVVRRPHSIAGAYPAFMDLVRRQLRRDYRQTDLNSEGLRIFTTLDPTLQQQVEIAARHWLAKLDRQHRLKGKLQTAIVMTNTANAEVLALLGDREPKYAGFNRALDASRPIGSLIKPAVYLTALKKKQHYTLASLIEDKPLTLKGPDNSRWSPRNYDGRSHGRVPLVTALMRSYNQATVRLGMALGFEAIADTLKRLGVKQPIPAYPSMLLGAIDLTPYEVTGMYQTLASAGFNSPLRAVREVLAANGTPLKRFPVVVKQRFDSESIEMIKRALNAVTHAGTARSLQKLLPPGLEVAGKTGTTNDLRDSWFAGYSGSHLAVVWLGRDDNQPVGLTGASGALKLWAGFMRKIDNQSLSLAEVPSLEYKWIDFRNGRLSAEDCESVLYLPFRQGEAPTKEAECLQNGMMDNDF